MQHLRAVYFEESTRLISFAGLNSIGTVPVKVQIEHCHIAPPGSQNGYPGNGLEGERYEPSHEQLRRPAHEQTLCPLAEQRANAYA